MRMRTGHGLHACVWSDLVVRCQFANFGPLACASSDSRVTPSVSTLSTVLTCPRDARRPLRTLRSTARSHDSNHLPLSLFPDLAPFSLPVCPAMASEGEPITDDSFTPRQLEVIRELIVANRPSPSAGAEIHRPPPAETPGPSSGESFGCMAVSERMHA